MPAPRGPGALKPRMTLKLWDTDPTVAPPGLHSDRTARGNVSPHALVWPRDALNW